jgi:hypothetical protein
VLRVRDEGKWRIVVSGFGFRWSRIEGRVSKGREESGE